MMARCFFQVGGPPCILQPVKLSAVVFAVLWTGWMVWWSGSFDPVNIIMLTICGAVAGYAWYRAMRWQLPRGRVPSRHGPRQ